MDSLQYQSFFNNQEYNLLDLTCYRKILEIENWRLQTLQINSIEIQQFNLKQAAVLISVKSSTFIEINKIRILESQSSIINQLQTSEFISFSSPYYKNKRIETVVNISNVEVYNLNLLSSQFGIIYGDLLDTFSIKNTILTSNSIISSFQGSFLSLTQTKNVNIYNSTFIIGNQGKVKSDYGGFIYLNNILQISIQRLKVNTSDNEYAKFQGIQGGILYINSIRDDISVHISEVDISHIETSADGGFAYFSGSQIILEDIRITSLVSQKNGGAFFINFSNQFSLENVVIYDTKSYIAGGAIFGGQITSAKNVTIDSCSALFGGGFFRTINIEQFKDQIIFRNKNTSNILAGIDYCNDISAIKINEFGEFNQNLPDPLKLQNYNIVYDGSFDKINITNLYYGLTYFATISIQIDDVWYNKLPTNLVDQGFNDLTSSIIGYEYLSIGNLPKQKQIPFKTDQIYFALFFQQQYGNPSFGPFQAVFSLFNTSDLSSNFYINSEITSYCGNGMIQQSFEESIYCTYCVDSISNIFQFPKIPTDCLSCPKAYFDDCNANISNLKLGFWRETITVDSDKIFPCSIMRQNCKGGHLPGNDLCVEGHMGIECIECDLHNERGLGSFSRTNIYSCSKCDDISFNATKMIILIVILLIVILIIFKTNFRQQKNFVYKKYLSDMGIIYLGKSYYRLGKSGSYIRILSFYFQIINISSYFYGSNTWKQYFSFQQTFYNPIVSSTFSFDCFLVQYSSNKQTSIAYNKITIISISPFIIVAIALIPSLLMLIFRKSTLKKFKYSLSLVISYAFTTLFCIPIIDVLVSGMLCRTFNNGQQYSIIDFNTECSDPDRLTFLFTFIIPFLFIYSLGIPGILLYFLVKNRKNLDKISCRFFLGFLYIDYKPQFFYWEFVRLFIKLVLIISLYCFLSSTQLIGFVSIAVLIMYLIILVKKQPYVTKKLNNMEQKSVVTGCLFLIAFMIEFSLDQQQIIQQNINQEYHVFSMAAIIIANLLSLSFIAYMIYFIAVSIINPHLYKFQKYRFYQFITKYLRILSFKKYTEKKRQNINNLRKLAFSFIHQKQIGQSFQLESYSEKQSLNSFVKEYPYIQTNIQIN